MQPDYCSSFQEEAKIVWRAMTDARRLGIPRNEETTTENLLLNLAKKHSGRGLTIKTFSKDEERDHGADWGFWFADGSHKGIAVRLQAKRLYRVSGCYDQLHHAYKGVSKSGQTWATQCEAMLGWGDGAIPMYVFYNDDNLRLPVAFSKMPWPYIFKHGLFSVANSAWGITAASALSIKNAHWGRKNRPGDFPMIPWHYLVCPSRWDSAPTNASLPSLIGRSLQRLYGYRRGEEEVAERKFSDLPFKFEPTSKRPPWVDFLLEGSAFEERLAAEMDKQNLKGVAIIQETEVRLD